MKLASAISVVLIAALGGSFWLAYQQGESAGQARESAACTQRIDELNGNIAEMERAARKQERQYQAAMAQLTDHLHQEMQDAVAEKNDLLRDVRAGNVRLRDKFNQCTTRVSQAPRDSGGSNETQPPLISRADQEFLVRLGHEADDVARRLTACQSILRELQQ